MEGTLTSGKKWPSGTSASNTSLSANFTTINGATKKYTYMTLPKPEFSPSIIVVEYNSGNTSITSCVVNNRGYACFYNNTTQTLNPYTFKYDSSCIDGNLIRIPIWSSNIVNPTFNWYAFE